MSEHDKTAAEERARLEREIRELKEALEAERKVRYEFLSTLSHELRNPLSPIKSSLFILERAGPGSEQARLALDVLRRQADHLTEKVDDLLDVARLRLGRIDLRRERVDLAALACAVAQACRRGFDEAGIGVRIEVPPEPVWLSADPTRIRSVLSHLLANAMRFPSQGDEARLSLGVEASEAVLVVADNGPGVAPEHLPRLFEPFEASDPGDTRGVQRLGLGMGLALVKGIVEAHGGTVEAGSAGLGHGVAFTVRLPLESRRPETAPRSEPRRPRPSVRRVLLVEDHRDQAAGLGESLRLLGHEVETAYDGPSGIAAARRYHPDAILCDLGLPGASGYDVARALRADPDLREVKLIAITGYLLTEDEERALAAGFDYHISKPADMELLERLLAEE